MTKKTILRGAAGVAAMIAVAIGGVAVSSGSGASSSSTAAAKAGSPGSAPSGTLRGAPPTGRGGFGGTPVTGTTAAKAKAAALARYPGTVERIFKTATGYEVHVIKSGGAGEVHVLVSSAFKVTGVETGPPGGGAPPQGATPPQGGSAPTAPSGTTTTT